MCLVPYYNGKLYRKIGLCWSVHENSHFNLISLQNSHQISGDGWCDDFNNKPECYFDAGDCCFNVDPQFCTKCECYTDGKF